MDPPPLPAVRPIGRALASAYKTYQLCGLPEKLRPRRTWEGVRRSVAARPGSYRQTPRTPPPVVATRRRVRGAKAIS